MKTTYKVTAATGFRGHKAGEEFEAELDQDVERRANERGSISVVKRADKSQERRRRRPMAKRIALKDHVSVDAVDLSNFARSVEFSSEHERVDVSGFNATGANEYLAGQTEQSVTVEFYGATGPARCTRPSIRSTATARSSRSSGGPTRPPPSSATNPQLEGNVQLLTYNAGRDPRRSGNVRRSTFIAADADGLAYIIAP